MDHSKGQSPPPAPVGPKTFTLIGQVGGKEVQFGHTHPMSSRVCSANEEERKLCKFGR